MELKVSKKRKFIFHLWCIIASEFNKVRYSVKLLEDNFAILFGIILVFFDVYGMCVYGCKFRRNLYCSHDRFIFFTVIRIVISSVTRFDYLRVYFLVLTFEYQCYQSVMLSVECSVFAFCFRHFCRFP